MIKKSLMVPDDADGKRASVVRALSREYIRKRRIYTAADADFKMLQISAM